MTPDDTHMALSQHISESLAYVGGRAARLQRVDAVLQTTTLISGALSTLLAGLSAALGTSLLGVDVPGWRLTCAVAALLTFAGTVASGLKQQLHVAELLEKARAYTGRLSALQIALEVGDTAGAEIARQYADLVAEYQSVLG